MIDDTLLGKFARIQELPVSEEMLGAYLEGGLDSADSIGISTIIDSDPDLSLLSAEVGSVQDGIDSGLLLTDDYDLIDTDFELPAIEEDVDEILFPEMSCGTETALPCDTPFANETFDMVSADSDRIPDAENNIFPSSDSFDTDFNSLDSDNVDETYDNLMNKVLEF